MNIEDANDMNVPVNCFLVEPAESDSGKWEWHAVNFMPRKERCGEPYEMVADCKEDILEAVRKFVVPLYRAALDNLNKDGGNYFWERVTDETD